MKHTNYIVLTDEEIQRCVISLDRQIYLHSYKVGAFQEKVKLEFEDAETVKDLKPYMDMKPSKFHIYKVERVD